MRNTQWISTVSNLLLTLCAVTVTALVVRRELFSPAPAGPPVEKKLVSDWRSYAQGGHRAGPADAPVSIVVFSDFQCPACRTLASHLKAVRAEFPQVAVVHRHSPLSIHPFAVEAARASDCAARQGRFEPFHDALFAEQESIGVTPWSRFARTAGLPDLPSFERCLASSDASGPLERDTVDARRLNVTGTPTYLVNGHQFVGAPPFDTLRARVQRAARSAHAPAAGPS
jgi:protein-disulfide isomerase